MGPRDVKEMPCRKLPPILNLGTTNSKMNKDEWHQETTQFGTNVRGQEEVLFPGNMFREMEQHINRLVKVCYTWNETHIHASQTHNNIMCLVNIIHVNYIY
mgnify:CR=1 FL=1